MTVPPSSQSVVQIVENKINENNSKRSSISKWCCSGWTAILAEIVSTSLLILLGCMSTIPIDSIPYQSPSYAPLAFGFVVMINVQIFGHLSGAHMNPAVTISAVLWGSLSISMGAAYLIAQFVGASLGYGILTLVYPIDLGEGAVCVTAPHAMINAWQALGIEIALTSGLIFVCCAVWDPVNKEKQESVPLKFALTIAGLSLVGGPLTGASMNPIRSLAPAMFTGSWEHHWIYWIGPIVGSFFATLCYKIIWLKKEVPIKVDKTDDRIQDIETKGI